MIDATQPADRDPGLEGARDARGRFQPGQSGNPAGKKPGTRNWSTRFRLMLEEGEFGAAARVIIDKAKAGHFPAAKFLVEHVDPKPRGRPITLDVAPDASLLQRYQALTHAMLTGEISPQEAHAVARLLERESALKAAEPVAPRLASRPPAETPTRAPAATAAPAPHLHPASKPALVPAPLAASPASGLHVPLTRGPAARAEPGFATA